MEGIILGVLGSIELTCHGQQVAGDFAAFGTNYKSGNDKHLAIYLQSTNIYKQILALKELTQTATLKIYKEPKPTLKMINSGICKLCRH